MKVAMQIYRWSTGPVFIRPREAVMSPTVCVVPSELTEKAPLLQNGDAVHHSSNAPFRNMTWSQHVRLCRSLLCLQDHRHVWRRSSLTAPVFVCAFVCVPVCMQAWCVCCALANLHGDSIPRLWLSAVAVLGCHFSSFAGYWDNRAEGSVWAAGRLKEVLLLNDMRVRVEECALVRSPLSSIGKPGSLAHKKNNTAVHTSPVPSPPRHFWANTQMDGAGDAGLLEYIHIDRFAYMHSSTARNLQAKTEM